MLVIVIVTVDGMSYIFSLPFFPYLSLRLTVSPWSFSCLSLVPLSFPYLSIIFQLSSPCLSFVVAPCVSLVS